MLVLMLTRGQVPTILSGTHFSVRILMKPRKYSCGLDAAIDVIGGRWKALILWALHHGPVRTGDLRRSVSGISEKMLIQVLRETEADHPEHREVFHEVPPRVEYSLTSLGARLNEAL